MTSPAFPEPPSPLPPTPFEAVDALVDRVASKKDDWLAVRVPERIQYLKRCLDGMIDVAERWVEDGCRLKGLDPNGVLAGEEWVAGPAAIVRNLRLFLHALEQGGRPRPSKVSARKDGQLVARVFPASIFDRLLFTGFTGEVWIEPGKPATQGQIYREPPTSGKVSLVLGAGNVSSIPPMDVLYKLFVEDEVVVLKMNPVNAHVGPHLERAFAPLIDDGYLAIVYGGADVGAHLADHPKVDTLHVTGSDRTYDAIVWGADPDERARRKAQGAPKNARPFTAELGCVTPVLVVPGPWNEADMDFQARQVAGMVAQNASFNCNAAKVIVTAKGWPQRRTFLSLVEKHLAKTAPRKAYYPGAAERYQGFVERYPRAKKLGADGEGVVPWTLIPDVPAERGEYALTNEAFCGVLAEVALDVTDPATFLREAVDFANDSIWGTLSCMLLVHPTTARDYATELDDAIARLRYGGIAVNCWAAVLYALVVTTWGAYPGHTKEDIQSGTGVVHNAFLFDHPQKSVIRAPFRIFPTPVWFADHKNLAAVGRNLTHMEARPSWGNLLKVAAAAMRG
jgi:acyl-CoA reductase-like NAD-dependent aldehyde dehydrogenase